MKRILGDIRAKSLWVHGESTSKSFWKTVFGDGTTAMVWYRCMQTSQSLGLSLAAAFFNRLNTAFCNCIIGRDATFGANLVLIHSTGVVINSDVVGGDDIHIEHQVTIGAEKGASPQLGSRIFIGAGAKIIGNIRIGDDVKIGANAVVLQDVPDGCTAVGVPAKILQPTTDPA